MELSDILSQLREKFPAADHKQRKLPGGNEWYFITWQRIRERFDEVCPGLWEVSYSTPVFVGDYCTITCTIAILGISRQGIGSAEIVQLSSSGKDMSRGNPIERATADSFKNAAEAWQVARYLDEQADEKTKRDFIRWMQAGGNGKAAVIYQQQQVQARSTPDRSNGSAPPKASPVISDAQRKRLYAIATNEGRYTDEGFRRLVESAGFASSRDITKAAYDKLCERAKDPIEGTAKNATPQPAEVPPF